MGIDYSKIGFRCGLEVHQQIESHKLFCKCPTIKDESSPDYRIKRYLRSVAGETGEIDIAAEFEAKKKRYFLYEGHNSNSCLIELDECPPYPINKQALETTLKVALLLNAKIVDEVQIMRKTVVDGSNVSGFQRTALVATDGFIETSKGKVGIPTICLEEEAAQKIEDARTGSGARTKFGISQGDTHSVGKDGYVKYRLDRLGIPLIEIATDSNIKDNEHAKEAAAYIGMVLRSVPGVKRGLGTIRQDVNVSIENGSRTEIKGFQDLRSIPKIIDYEIRRQLNAVNKGEKLNREVRKVEPDFTTSFLRPLPGAARLYPETDVAHIKINKKYIEELKKQLPKLLAHKTEEFEGKYRIAKELAKELVGNELFEELVKKYNKLEPQLIAHTLINIPKEIKTRFKEDISRIDDRHFDEILDYLNKGIIAKEAIIDLLIKKIRNEKIKLEEFAGVSLEGLEKEIKELLEKKKGLNIGAYMGIIMGKYRGKVDGKKIMELLKKFVK